MSITQLNPQFPPDDEQLSEGAGRIRDIKAAIVETFPGFDKPLNSAVNSTWLNSLALVFAATQDGLAIYPNKLTDLDTFVQFHKDGSVEFKPSGLTVTASGAIYTSLGYLVHEDDVKRFLDANTLRRNKMESDLDGLITTLEDKLKNTTTGTSPVSLDLTAQLAQVKSLRARADALLAHPQTLAKQVKDYFKVGDLYLTQDVVDPNTKFDGTWEQLTDDDTVLASTTQALDVNAPVNTEVVGSNSKPIPVPKHNHTGRFTGQTLPKHRHGLSAFRAKAEKGSYYQFTQMGTTYSGMVIAVARKERIPHIKRWSKLVPTNTSVPGSYTEQTTRLELQDGQSAGTPTGKVVVDNYGTSIKNLDVRGKRMPIYIWKRVL